MKSLKDERAICKPGLSKWFGIYKLGIYKLYRESQCKLIKTRVDIKLLMEQTH